MHLSPTSKLGCMSFNGFAHHRSWVQDPVGTVLYTEFSTDHHSNSIELSVRWCVWKVGYDPSGTRTHDLQYRVRGGNANH